MSSEIQTKSPVRRMLTAAFAFALIGAAGSAACGDDGGNGQSPGPDGGGGTGSDGGGTGSGTSAVIVAERVFATDGSRSYFVSALPSVPTSGTLDRAKATEFISADIEVFNGKLFIRNRNDGTMTRYSVSADYKLVKEDAFSFQNVGVAGNRYSSAYLSPTRALLLDSTRWKLIGWDPSKMELTGETIDVISMSHPEFKGAGGQISAPVKVGDKWMAAVYWEYTAQAPFLLYPGSGVMIIDPAAPAGTLPQLIEDKRLGGAFRITADGGDAYMSGVADGAARLYGGVFENANKDPFPSSGVLKLAAGATAFDANYFINIEDITKTKAAWAVHRLSNTKLLVQVFDPAAQVPATAADYQNSTSFLFGTIDSSGSAPVFTPFDDKVLPHGGRANAGNYQLDGKLYIQLSGATGSTSYAVSADGTAAPSITVPAGDIWAMAQVR